MPCVLWCVVQICKSATKMKSRQSLVCDVMITSSVLSGRRLSDRSCHRETLSCQEWSETNFHQRCQPLSITHWDFFINILWAVCTLCKCHKRNDASSRINMSVYQMRLHQADPPLGDPIISSDWSPAVLTLSIPLSVISNDRLIIVRLGAKSPAKPLHQTEPNLLVNLLRPHKGKEVCETSVVTLRFLHFCCDLRILRRLQDPVIYRSRCSVKSVLFFHCNSWSCEGSLGISFPVHVVSCFSDMWYRQILTFFKAKWWSEPWPSTVQLV